MEAELLLSKSAFYLAALCVIGLCAARARGDKRWSGLIATMAGLTIVLVAVRLVLMNAQLSGELLDFSMFGWVWPPVKWHVIAIFVGALLAFLAPFARGPWGALAAAGVISAGFALTGHVQGKGGELLPMLGVAVHVFIAGFWLVAPFVLWPGRSVAHPDLVQRMESFSTWALWLVPVLFVTGVSLAFYLTGSAGKLVGSFYGRLLILKLVLALMALGIGAANKALVTRKLKAAPETGRIWLRGALICDAVLFIGILLAIASATTLTGPE